LVVLVRHAEKASEPASDPPLTEPGAARAAALLDALKDARVAAVITTQYERTRATAAPVAAAAGLTPIIVRAGGTVDEHAHEVAQAVRARPSGETVLIVGHSNTVPAIIAALGGPRLPDLCDGEYDDLFLLTLPERGTPRMIRASYGKPNAPGSECRGAAAQRTTTWTVSVATPSMGT
jgi:broad specificity phosphatase PhoE